MNAAYSFSIFFSTITRIFENESHSMFSPMILRSLSPRLAVVALSGLTPYNLNDQLETMS